MIPGVGTATGVTDARTAAASNPRAGNRNAQHVLADTDPRATHLEKSGHTDEGVVQAGFTSNLSVREEQSSAGVSCVEKNAISMNHKSSGRLLV